MKRLLLALVVSTTIASPVFADKSAADQCAAGLDGDAKAIYVASAPGFAGTSDPRGLITEKTKALVMAGTISMGNARSAAEAAGSCLTQLR